MINSLALRVSTAAAMHDLGVRLAELLRAGDVVLLIGPLGAGKTTLAQGIGAGLAVTGVVNSPTFVIARVHRSVNDGPDLVHADLYRLGGRLELDDLDLDASVAESVTVVEWGEGAAETLAEDRLEVRLSRDVDEVVDAELEDEPRAVVLRPVGSRWAGVDLDAALSTIDDV